MILWFNPGGGSTGFKLSSDENTQIILFPSEIHVHSLFPSLSPYVGVFLMALDCYFQFIARVAILQWAAIGKMCVTLEGKRH